MTPIEQFFMSERTNASQLATLVGVSPSTVCRMLKGDRDASPDLARRIETATDGRLSAISFLSSCMEARARRQIALADQRHIRTPQAIGTGETA